MYSSYSLLITILPTPFQKEDVEVALRCREMNREEAQELLRPLRPLDMWRRRHDSHYSGYDPSNQATNTQAFPRFNHVSQQMSFPPVSESTLCAVCTCLVLRRYPSASLAKGSDTSPLPRYVLLRTQRRMRYISTVVTFKYGLPTTACRLLRFTVVEHLIFWESRILNRFEKSKRGKLHRRVT